MFHSTDRDRTHARRSTHQSAAVSKPGAGRERVCRLGNITPDRKLWLVMVSKELVKPVEVISDVASIVRGVLQAQTGVPSRAYLFCDSLEEMQTFPKTATGLVNTYSEIAFLCGRNSIFF